MKPLDYSIVGLALVFMGLSGLVDTDLLKVICEKAVVLCGGVLIGRSL